ncbi:MAG: hypothetical protein EPO42_09220 [Gallionellaceae bacterium]|nr:MAG: hypothetical protein EPO42_09220 [Gallionellaceae bacterium]
MLPVIVLTIRMPARTLGNAMLRGQILNIQKPVYFGGFVLAIARLSDYWLNISILPKNNK